jgi:tRNA-dihydrouridine synthase
MTVAAGRRDLTIGPIQLRSPVVLAPMAGVTNVAFRTLCRELELTRAGTVSGLYVCEMVTARALVERHPNTMHMVTFAPDESPRSLQLYSVDPANTYAAAKMIVDENLADHIDMNFGCPVPKVTRRGGGAGVQRYSGAADWERIAELKQHVTDIPVLGNGDIFEAADALAMMAQTGCDGVVIGRGCLGRPWLFAELSAAFSGALGEVAQIMLRHGQLLAAHFGEDKGMRDMRKHIAWYLHGFPAGADLRRALALVKTLSELEDLVGQLDPTVPFPEAATGPRGRQGSAASVTLPEGWLDDPDDCTVPAGAEVMHSGG